MKNLDKTNTTFRHTFPTEKNTMKEIPMGKKAKREFMKSSSKIFVSEVGSPKRGLPYKRSPKENHASPKTRKKYNKFRSKNSMSYTSMSRSRIGLNQSMSKKRNSLKSKKVLSSSPTNWKYKQLYKDKKVNIHTSLKYMGMRLNTYESN